MKGSFTLPGEAGYEPLTLRLAEAWGADVIRDSDGTDLSPDLLGAGYDIYATICLIRSINDWAKDHPDMLQQNLLLSMPVLATGETLQIGLLSGYSRDQFRVNDQDGIAYWQAHDRTSGTEIPRDRWRYENGVVTIEGCIPYHRYTVSFFAFRLWEAISMYNHITNGWGDKERLMPVEPRHPAVQKALLDWLDAWCLAHPRTDVIRFTSMFYNFAWIWSDDPRARDVFSDWGSYDFSVNPLSLRAFEAETGISLTAEDFLKGGLRHPTHNAPDPVIRKWMDFTHAFVASFGRECVDVAHRHGKKAYVFYDDSWIGVEPYGPRFADFAFDGIIKCVFGGYETRLCAGVPHVATREIRLHPYLFPTGLQGEPTFAPGGDPTPELKRYFTRIRRALLRAPVDRIGLGGYLHLVEPFPAFIEAVGNIADAFRALKALMKGRTPAAYPGKIGVLTAWGGLRPWSTSGHLHEHPEVDLTNALEALSGLPFDVVFLSFDELLTEGIPKDVAILLNAGWAGSAYSGGPAWKNPDLQARVTEWVHGGGGLVGIGEPTAGGAGEPLTLSHLFGVNRDNGSRKCQRKYKVQAASDPFIGSDGAQGIAPLSGIYLEAPDTRVLHAADDLPLLAVREVGKGRAVYLSGFRFSMQAAGLFHRCLCYAGRMEDAHASLACSNPLMECAVLDGDVIVINNDDKPQTTRVPGVNAEVSLPPQGWACLGLSR